MSSVEKVLEELRDRAIRTESRIVQLGDHVGANLRVKQKIEIVGRPEKTSYVLIDSLDVSVSRILAKLKEAGNTPNQIDVLYDGRLVFTLYPKEH